MIALSMLSLCSLIATAQNTLGEVAEISNLPDNMPKVKHWVSLLLDRSFIGDLQTSSSSKGDATFLSFKLKGGEQNLTLPATGGMSVHFKQKGATKNPWLASTGTFSVQYKRELLAYGGLPMTEFRHGDNLFYFKLAMDLIKLNDAQMIAQVLNYFVEADRTYAKFDIMNRQLNTSMKLNMPAPSGKVETIGDYLPMLAKYFKGEALKDAIFRTYILGKTQIETDRNLHRFFSPTSGPFSGSNVASKLSELNDPSFNLATETPEQLRIPYKLLKMPPKQADSVFRYDYQYIVGKFNLAARSLELTFKGKHLNPVPLKALKIWSFDAKKGADWKPATQLGGKSEVNFTELTLIVSEQDITLSGRDFEEIRYLIWQMAWPKDFVKTSIKDWR